MEDRLDFVLPEFTRICWASEAARNLWEPRFCRIEEAWADIEWRSVAEGIRKCCLVHLSTRTIATAVSGAHRFDLTVVPLPPLSAKAEAGATDVVVGQGGAAAAFSKAWPAAHHDAVGELLGVPECCRRFFERVVIQEHHLDATWNIGASSGSSVDSRALKINGCPETNVLWAALGIRAIPHFACNFHCPASVLLGQQLLELGARIGYEDEVAWIRYILSLPAEWSALHGIAEMKSPILKFVTRTDATASKYSIAWQSEVRAEEAATGLSFPNIVPLRALLTDSPSFRRGLEHGERGCTTKN